MGPPGGHGTHRTKSRHPKGLIVFHNRSGDDEEASISQIIFLPTAAKNWQIDQEYLPTSSEQQHCAIWIGFWWGEFLQIQNSLFCEAYLLFSVKWWIQIINKSKTIGTIASDMQSNTQTKDTHRQKRHPQTKETHTDKRDTHRQKGHTQTKETHTDKRETHRQKRHTQTKETHKYTKTKKLGSMTYNTLCCFSKRRTTTSGKCARQRSFWWRQLQNWD